LKKGDKMNTSELKLKLLQEIDTLEKSKLQEVYGYIQNIIRGNQDLEDWDNLSVAQQDGLKAAINDIESGYGISHKDVIAKYRKKFTDA
jgi:hypothetical protein